MIGILDRYFEKWNRIDASVIRGIDSNGKIWTLKDYLKQFQNSTPIDVTIKVKSQKIVKPTIKVKIN